MPHPCCWQQRSASDYNEVTDRCCTQTASQSFQIKAQGKRHPCPGVHPVILPLGRFMERMQLPDDLRPEGSVVGDPFYVRRQRPLEGKWRLVRERWWVANFLAQCRQGLLSTSRAHPAPRLVVTFLWHRRATNFNTCAKKRSRYGLFSAAALPAFDF